MTWRSYGRKCSNSGGHVAACFWAEGLKSRHAFLPVVLLLCSLPFCLFCPTCGAPGSPANVHASLPDAAALSAPPCSEMATRNAKDKVMLPQIRRALGEAHAALAAAEGAHAASAKAIHDREKLKKMHKF